MKKFIIGTLIFAGGITTGIFVMECGIGYLMSKVVDGDEKARIVCNDLRMFGDAIAGKRKSYK